MCMCVSIPSACASWPLWRRREPAASGVTRPGNRLQPPDSYSWWGSWWGWRCVIPPHTPQTPAGGPQTQRGPPYDYTCGQGALTEGLLHMAIIIGALWHKKVSWQSVSDAQEDTVVCWCCPASWFCPGLPSPSARRSCSLHHHCIRHSLLHHLPYSPRPLPAQNAYVKIIRIINKNLGNLIVVSVHWGHKKWKEHSYSCVISFSSSSCRSCTARLCCSLLFLLSSTRGRLNSMPTQGHKMNKAGSEHVRMCVHVAAAQHERSR